MQSTSVSEKNPSNHFELILKIYFELNRRMDMEIQKWEYKTVRILSESFVQDCKGMLNRIGGEGWELAFILPPSDRPDALVF